MWNICRINFSYVQSWNKNKNSSMLIDTFFMCIYNVNGSLNFSDRKWILMIAYHIVQMHHHHHNQRKKVGLFKFSGIKWAIISNNDIINQFKSIWSYSVACSSACKVDLDSRSRKKTSAKVVKSVVKMRSLHHIRNICFFLIHYTRRRWSEHEETTKRQQYLVTLYYPRSVLGLEFFNFFFVLCLSDLMRELRRRRKETPK